MSKKQKRPRDVNVRAASTVALATGEAEEAGSKAIEDAEATEEERHMAAVMLGRKGGKARAEKLTMAERKEIARRAAGARWNRK